MIDLNSRMASGTVLMQVDNRVCLHGAVGAGQLTTAAMLTFIFCNESKVAVSGWPAPADDHRVL